MLEGARSLGPVPAVAVAAAASEDPIAASVTLEAAAPSLGVAPAVLKGAAVAVGPVLAPVTLAV